MEVTRNDELFDQLSRAEIVALVRARLLLLKLSPSDRHLILVRFMVDKPVSVRRLALTYQVPEAEIRRRISNLKAYLRFYFADLRDAA